MIHYLLLSVLKATTELVVAVSLVINELAIATSDIYGDRDLLLCYYCVLRERHHCLSNLPNEIISLYLDLFVGNLDYSKMGEMAETSPRLILNKEGVQNILIAGYTYPSKAMICMIVGENVYCVKKV